MSESGMLEQLLAWDANVRRSIIWDESDERNQQDKRCQKLVDLCFSIALTIGDTRLELIEAKAEWIAKQLRDNGFDTRPVGMSWGVLRKDQS